MSSKNLTAAGFGIAALLALTACGDADDAGAAEPDGAETQNAAESGNSTFTFDGTASGEEVRIEVPTDTEGAEDRVLDAVTVRDSAEAECGIEADFEYAAGVEEQLTENEWHRALGYSDEPEEEAPEENKYAKLAGFDKGTLSNSIMDGHGTEYLSEDFQSATIPCDDDATSVILTVRTIDNWVDPEVEEIPDDGGTDIYWPGYAQVGSLVSVEVQPGDGEVSVAETAIPD